MSNRTLVKIVREDKYLSFKTITREGKSFPFLISKGTIGDLLELPHTVVPVADAGSFAQIWRDPIKERVHIRFYWLQGSGRQISGREETIILPFCELMAFNRGYMGDRWSVLSIEESCTPRLVFCGKKNLHSAVSEPQIRRKLVRFLRDNFQWRGADKILFYDDFLPYSFNFREMEGERAGICGGLIFHGSEDMKTAHYSIHT